MGLISLQDVRQQLQLLKNSRPIFHSEHDFKFALAWQLKSNYQSLDIRLEKRLPGQGKNEFADIWIGKDNHAVALELKYPKTKWHAFVSQEEYVLKPGAADDQARYRFWQDVGRLERWVADGHCARGYAILLTNSTSYWKESLKEDSYDVEFRVHEGRKVGPGTLKWDEKAAEGTAGMGTPVRLTGQYHVAWYDYSDVELHNPPPSAIKRNCSFKYMVIEVARTGENVLP